MLTSIQTLQPQAFEFVHRSYDCVYLVGEGEIVYVENAPILLRLGRSSIFVEHYNSHTLLCTLLPLREILAISPP